MGRLSSVHRRDGPSPARVRFPHPTDRLCRYGAVAGVDGSAVDRAGNISAPPAVESDCQRHLTHLLTPLHDQPDSLASRLLYRFGSIGRIAQASDIELRQAANADETWVDALLSVRQLMHDGMREKLLRTKLGEDREALFSYLVMTMQNLSEERMLAIFADQDGYVIAEEVIAEGGDAHVMVTPRRIFGRAMNLNARRVLLVHNHPSGSAEPSLLDIEHTRHLSRHAHALGLIIEDHFIVGGRKVTSMKDRGLV